MLIMNNSKFFLRKSFKKQRSLLDINQVQGLSKRIFENLLELNIWDKSFYHLYLSNEINNEVETDEIVNLLFMKNNRIKLTNSRPQLFILSYLYYFIKFILY